MKDWLGLACIATVATFVWVLLVSMQCGLYTDLGPCTKGNHDISISTIYTDMSFPQFVFCKEEQAVLLTHTALFA